MHSHDRTLLASLGFNDPDKRNRLHDLACQYFCQKEVAGRLAELVKFRNPTRRIELYHAETERLITKGEGQYRSHIGFIDCELLFNTEVEFKDRRSGEMIWDDGDLVIDVEVKITPVSFADIIRQIKLYREYYDTTNRTKSAWFVATRWNTSPLEREAFQREQIYCVTLGPSFDKWLAVQGVDIPK